jgi:hypothetical protein
MNDSSAAYEFRLKAARRPRVSRASLFDTSARDPHNRSAGRPDERTWKFHEVGAF